MWWFSFNLFFFLNIGTSGECIDLIFLSPAKRLMQTPACLQINRFGVFDSKWFSEYTVVFYPPNYNYGDSFENILHTYSSRECLEGRKILPEKGYHVCLFKQSYNVLRITITWTLSIFTDIFPLKSNIQTVVTAFVDLCGVAVYGQVRSTVCAIVLSVPQAKETGQGYRFNLK